MIKNCACRDVGKIRLIAENIYTGLLSLLPVLVMPLAAKAQLVVHPPVWTSSNTLNFTLTGVPSTSVPVLLFTTNLTLPRSKWTGLSTGVVGQTMFDLPGTTSQSGFFAASLPASTLTVSAGTGGTYYIVYNYLGPTYYASIPLQGVVSDILPYSVQWSELSGPYSPGINNSNKVNASVVTKETGTYVFKLTATDGDKTGSSQVTIIVGQKTRRG